MPEEQQRLSGDFPNLIVLGVGHSGTTILNRMLGELGWNTAAAGDVWEECRAIRDVNHRYLVNGEFDSSAAAKAVTALSSPWSIKDPRFVMTLHLWRDHFPTTFLPVLLWLVRDKDATARSYRTRGETNSKGEPGIYRRSVSELFTQARQQYDEWPGPRLALRYGDIAAAVALFRIKEPQ